MADQKHDRAPPPFFAAGGPFGRNLLDVGGPTINDGVALVSAHHPDGPSIPEERDLDPESIIWQERERLEYKPPSPEMIAMAERVAANIAAALPQGAGTFTIGPVECVSSEEIIAMGRRATVRRLPDGTREVTYVDPPSVSMSVAPVTDEMKSAGFHAAMALQPRSPLTTETLEAIYHAMRPQEPTGAGMAAGTAHYVAGELQRYAAERDEARANEATWRATAERLSTEAAQFAQSRAMMFRHGHVAVSAIEDGDVSRAELEALDWSYNPSTDRYDRPAVAAVQEAAEPRRGCYPAPGTEPGSVHWLVYAMNGYLFIERAKWCESHWVRWLDDRPTGDHPELCPVVYIGPADERGTMILPNRKIVHVVEQGQGNHDWKGPTEKHDIKGEDGGVVRTERRAVSEPVADRAHQVVGDILAGKVIPGQREQIRDALQKAPHREETSASTSKPMPGKAVSFSHQEVGLKLP